VASLKFRIMKVEDIACLDIQLVENTQGEALMKNVERVSFLAETFPCCVEDNLLAVVYHDDSKTPSSTSTMTKVIQAKYNFSE